MSKITAKDVVNFAKTADVELVEMTLELASNAVKDRKATKEATAKRLEKARAARGKTAKPAAETPAPAAEETATVDA